MILKVILVVTYFLQAEEFKMSLQTKDGHFSAQRILIMI
jgi:hypothetical protein